MGSAIPGEFYQSPNLASKHKIEQQIDAADKRIDKRVCELYYDLCDLTEEEMRIVEESTG